MEEAIEKYIKFATTPQDKDGVEKSLDLFDQIKKFSLQFVLNKIPNLKNEKRILCKLPNPLQDVKNADVCLIVKDINKSRDFEKTIRKYDAVLEANSLKEIIKRIIPVKQLKLEFRPFEAKRKLCSSSEIFLADKCLHDLLVHGSRLGKEFHKRKKLPISVDVESKDFAQNVHEILNSTSIFLNGKGPLIDVAAFLSTHTASEALANINTIREKIESVLPGGKQNIKAIYLKATNTASLPIYVNQELGNDFKIPNNVSKTIKARGEKRVKRLKEKTQREKLRKSERKNMAISKTSKTAAGVEKSKNGKSKTTIKGNTKKMLVKSLKKIKK